MKYIVTEGEEFTTYNDKVQVFNVHTKGMPDWEQIPVWHTKTLGNTACTACSSNLIAMSTKCKHANAVKRYIAKLAKGT